MKKVCFLLLLCLAGVCSCTSVKYYSLQPKYNEQFKDATKNEIYRSQGVPTRIVEMDEGEYVLVYEQYETNSSTRSYSKSNVNANADAGSYYNTDQTYANVYGNSNTYSGSNTRTTNDRKYTEFYMSKDDRCYSVRTNKRYGKEVYDSKKTTLNTIAVLGAAAAVIIPIVISEAM